MANYEQLPGELNLAFNRGDDISTLIDFSISMSSHTVTAVIYSLISGDTVQAFTVTAANASNGQYNISLTDAQTTAIPRGTYGWRMIWTENNATRTALTGFVEVL